MRSNSASELCTSSWTPSRLPIGKNSRVCSVVNATSVPIEIDRAAARLRPAGEPVDERRHHRERHLDRGHHPAAGHPASHLEVGEAPRLVREPLREVVGAAHRLAEQDARRPRATPARSTRRRRARPAARAVTFLRWSPTRFVSQTKSGSRISAKTASRQSSSTIATIGRDHRGHVREHRRRGRGDDRVDAADVVRDPALHVARAGAGEEREREPLQMLVDRRCAGRA